MVGFLVLCQIDLSFRFLIICDCIIGGRSDFLSDGLCVTELVSIISVIKSVIVEFIWSSIDSGGG